MSWGKIFKALTTTEGKMGRVNKIIRGAGKGISEASGQKSQEDERGDSGGFKDLTVAPTPPTTTDPATPAPKAPPTGPTGPPIHVKPMDPSGTQTPPIGIMPAQSPVSQALGGMMSEDDEERKRRSMSMSMA